MKSRVGAHLRANVVGYIALFFALGLGTAWALDANSVRSKHIVNGQVKGADVAESSLGRVPEAKSAQPKAFAHINTDGTVDAANSKGIRQSNVAYFGGIDDTYCIKGLKFKPRGGQAIADYSEASPSVHTVEFDLGRLTPTCPVGTQAFVYGADDSVAFYLLLYG